MIPCTGLTSPTIARRFLNFVGAAFLLAAPSLVQGQVWTGGLAATSGWGTGPSAVSFASPRPYGPALPTSDMPLGSGSVSGVSIANGNSAISGGTLGASITTYNYGGSSDLAQSTIVISSGSSELILGGFVIFDPTFTLTGGTFALDITAFGGYGLTYDILGGFSSGAVSGLTITGYDDINWLASLSTDGVLAFTPTAVEDVYADESETIVWESDLIESALAVEAVPEPATWTLLALALLALPRRGLRQQKRR